MGAFSYPSGGGAAAAGGSAYTHILTQKTVGGVTTYAAYDAKGNPVPGASNTTPDATPILRTLFQTAINTGQGVDIVVTPGSYQLTDRDGWHQDPNNSGWLYMVYVPLAGTLASTMSISITGLTGGGGGEVYTYFSLAGMGGHALNNVGVQFITNFASTTLAGVNANSVFGCLKSPTNFAGLNYVGVQLNNLRFTQQTNQWSSQNNWSSMIDGRGLSGLSGVGQLVIDTQTTDSSVMTQADSQNNIGLYMPSGSNQGLCHLDQVNVSGYGIGVYLSDHADIDYLYCQACTDAIQIGNASHLAHIGHFNPQQCKHYIALQYYVNALVIDILDPEPQTSGFQNSANNWQEFAGLFDNTGYPFMGEVNINYGPIEGNGAGAEFPSLNSPSLGTMPAQSYTNNGTNYYSSYTLHFIGDPVNIIAGTVSGTAAWNMPLMGSNNKKVTVNLSAFQSTSKIITFPVPFINTPTIITDASGGATVSTTTLTLPDTHLLAKTGLISVEGS